MLKLYPFFLFLISSCATKMSSTLRNISSDDWHDVQPVSKKVIYAYSYGGGTIVKTTNSGKSWKLNKQIDSIYLEQIHFTDETTGWICGGNGTMLRTADGGNNWEKQNVTNDSGTLLLYGLYFSDNMHGYTAGPLIHNSKAATKLFETINGGNSWQPILLPFNNLILNIEADNKGEIWLSGDNIIAKMKDNAIQLSFLDTTKATGQIRDIEFINDSTLCAVSFNGKFLLSKNNGKTWISNTVTSNRLRGITYIQNTLIAVGDNNKENGSVFNSIDGGGSWVKSSKNYPDVHRIIKNKNFIWLAGKKGLLQKQKIAELN